MKEFILANEVLNYVINDDITFKKALKKVFPNGSEDRKYLSSVSSLVGCELRHHLLFSRLVENLHIELSNEEKGFLYLTFANIFFLKHFKKDEVFSFLKGVLKDKYNEDIEKILAYQGNVGDLLNIDRTSLDYISIRFNTPTWLIKMWNKHYGKSITFKALKANSLPLKNEYRYDENSNVSLNDDFVETDIENIYSFVGKGSPRKLDVIEKNIVFPMKGIYKKILDDYIDDLSDEYCLYSGSDDALIKDLYIRSKNEKGINVIVPDISKRAEMLRFIRINKIKNINIFMGNEEIAFKTGISHKQDMIIVNPLSSSFDKIRQYPDYLIHFKRDSLDELINNEIHLLNDLSLFVNDDGLLVYMVDTMNKKETVGIVNNFLKDHQDFELASDKQYFPFEKENATLYLAVIRKKAKND